MEYVHNIIIYKDIFNINLAGNMYRLINIIGLYHIYDNNITLSNTV